MKEASVVITTTEGWEGMYVDGYLFEEGEVLNNKDWSDLVNKFKYFVKVEHKWISPDQFEELGWSFPFKLSNIPNEYLQ